MSTLVNKLNAKFGRNVCALGNDPSLRLRKISTGILGADIALSGGLCRGRFTQVWGPESAGKTTLTTIMARNFLRAVNQKVAFIDIESSFDPNWAVDSGLSLEDFILIFPAFAEEACAAIVEVIRDPDYGLVILDSIGAMAGKAETEGEMGDAHVAPIPRLLSQFFRRATAAIQSVDNPPAIVLLNQRREKIMSFGDPTTYSGGNALKHFLSVDLQVRRGEEYTEEGKLMPDIQGDSDKSRGKKAKPNQLPVVAYDVLMRTRKNKTGFTAPIMRTHLALTNTEVLRAGHVDTARDLVRMGSALGIVQRAGSMYKTLGRDFRGGDAIREALREDEEFQNELYRTVLEEAIGPTKYSEIEAASFFEKVKKSGKSDSPPGWRKKAAGKRK